MRFSFRGTPGKATGPKPDPTQFPASVEHVSTAMQSAPVGWRHGVKYSHGLSQAMVLQSLVFCCRAAHEAPLKDFLSYAVSFAALSHFWPQDFSKFQLASLSATGPAPDMFY